MNRCDRQLRRQEIKQQAAGAALAKSKVVSDGVKDEEAAVDAKAPLNDGINEEVSAIETPPPPMNPRDRLRTPTAMSCEYLLRSYAHNLSIDVASRPHPRMLGMALSKQFREGADPTSKEDGADINCTVYNGIMAAASSSVRATQSKDRRKSCLESVASNIAVSVDLWARTEGLTSSDEPHRKQVRVEKPTHTSSNNTCDGEPLMRPVEMLRHCKYLFGTGKARRDIDEPYLFFDKKLKTVRGDDLTE